MIERGSAGAGRILELAGLGRLLLLVGVAFWVVKRLTKRLAFPPVSCKVP